MSMRFSGILLGVIAMGCTGGPAAPTCELTTETLVGKAFVMSEAQPKGEDILRPQARLTFVDDGGVKAKYTAMSLGDIYTYDCTTTEKDGVSELKCVEKERLQDWCEALLARDISCTKKKLKKLGATADDATLDTAISAAKKSKQLAESDTENPIRFKRWKGIRASLGNKLQGQLYAKVDPKRCRLRIDDLYWTLKPDGTKVEDSNPVGSNPFVKTDEPWMFEHCDNQADLWDLETDAFPKTALNKPPAHATGKPIYYFHTGKKAEKAEEGCTYSFDTYAGWKPLKQGIAATPNEEGRVIWRAEHTFSESDVREANGVQVGLFHMVRYKECGGKKERIDTSCRVSKL